MSSKLDKIYDIIDKQNEMLENIAFFANLAKNGQCVATGKNEVLTRLYTGQLIYVDRRDISVASHLIMSGFWEFETTEIFRRYIKEDSVVFDVGANFGYYGIIAGCTNNHGEIHFFEANPQLIKYIWKSLTVNGLLARSHINSCAVAEKSGEIRQINLLSPRWGGSSLAPVQADNNYERITQKEVNTLSLDDYCRQHDIKRVDVIKMDIEGYEEHAFEGMTDILANNKHLVILMEYTLGKYSDDFFPFLKNHFRVSVINNSETQEIWDQSTLDDNHDDLAMLLLEPLS